MRIKATITLDYDIQDSYFEGIDLEGKTVAQYEQDIILKDLKENHFFYVKPTDRVTVEVINVP